MTSSAFSVKKFDTIAPAICKPPPWPPIVPPPPIEQAIFYVQATIEFPNPSNQIHSSASQTANYDSAIAAWRGPRQPPPQNIYIGVTLWTYPLSPTYNLEVEWHWPPNQYRVYTWYARALSETRPYVGDELRFQHAFTDEYATAIVREKPF